MTPEQFATWTRQQAGPEGVRLTRALVPEPGLPWLSKVFAEAKASGQLDRLRSFAFLGDEMAPAFPAGCHVAAEPVNGPDEVLTGHIYAVTVDGCPRYAGRLAEVLHRPYALRLTYDNAVDEAPVIIDWHDAAVQLWRVTHYLSYRVQ